MKFYICEHCKNVVIKVSDHQVPVFCCGEMMKELVANTTDAASEKHVPVVCIDGNKVNVEVGSTLHPMTNDHLIEWIVLETNQGYSIHHLSAKQQPKTSFVLNDDEKVVAVYEYCNLHGLWKIEL